MEPQHVCVMKGLTKAYPPDGAGVRNLWLSVPRGAKVGVLGRSGAGKSTLLRILAGETADYEGELRLASGTSVGYLPQAPRLDPGRTVADVIDESVSVHRRLLKRYDELTRMLSEGHSDLQEIIDEQGEVERRIAAAGAWKLEARVKRTLDALRIPPGRTTVDVLAPGAVRRVALCRLLLEAPDLLLLDDPTCQLDAEIAAWIERVLADYRGTVVVATHDRSLLEHSTGWILELDRGTGIPWEGNYSSWLAEQPRRLEGAPAADAARRPVIERELEWIQLSARARQAAGQARLSGYERRWSTGSPAAVDADEVALPAGPRLGEFVVRADALVKGFGERALISDLSFNLPPGGIAGVVGPNGAGKTTLLRMLAGTEAPDAGTLTIGDAVTVACVDGGGALDPDRTVLETVTAGRAQVTLGPRRVDSGAFLAWFDFTPADRERMVGSLSDRERYRVQLAALFQAGANLLLLDEPTEALGVDTLRMLEDALVGFAGCAVVVSHDRWFLDRVATHIAAFEGRSEVVWFEGNYSAYENDRRRRLGSAADQPQPITYRRLVRG